MRYRKLTSTGDYSFGNSLRDFYIDIPEAVAQAVQTRLLLWLGEWYLDVTEGVPYLEGVIGKHPDPQATADQTIKTVIQGTQGFADIIEFQSEINPDTRAYKVPICEIDTIYGPTAVEIANNGNF